jgi:hypothetical protein
VGIKYPEKVEAFIKRCFKRVIKHRYQASQDFFNGKHFNKTTSGEGLASYLDYQNCS